MHRLAYRLACATVLISSSRFPARGEPQAADGIPGPEANKTAGTDLYGDPLPPGALARLGTMRWRHEHISASLSTALSPDGKTVATAGSSSLRLWDVASGKLLWQVRSYFMSRMQFSPDGRWLVVNDDSLLDSATGKLVLRCPTKAYPLAFSPDSTLLAVGGDAGTVILWHTANGKETVRLKGHEQPVHSAAFPADGRILVTVCHGNRVCRWDVAEGKLVNTVEMPIPQWRTIKLSPDGRTLAVSASGAKAVRLLDTATGKETIALQGDPAGAQGLAFTRDGRTLATVWMEADGIGGTLSLWDTATGKRLRSFPVAGRGLILPIDFSPDGRMIVTAAGEPRVRLWDTTTGHPLSQHAAHDGEIV